MNKISDIKKIEEKALNLFNSEFNCSQSVLSVYSDFLNLDNKTALGIASGFGAGMGRLQGTCGAVTGAYMIFGLYCNNKFTDYGVGSEKAFLMIQYFNNKFVEKHKTTDCRLLLNCDLQTEEGQMQFHVNNLLEKVCEVCIKDSIQLINEQIN